LIAVGIVFLALFSFAAYGISSTQQAPEQPLQFPHDKHVKLGVQCLYCHPGAARGPAAGIPSQAKCWACHQQMEITQTSKLLKPLRDAVLSGKPLQWVPVVQVPDFVQFNHRAHIAGGQNCENCHGDMTKVTVAENPQIFNMGFCLNCHKKIGAEDHAKLVKLTDCGTCHY
jgi:Cytochrome c7 and related cytochrome c